MALLLFPRLALLPSSAIFCLFTAFVGPVRSSTDGKVSAKLQLIDAPELGFLTSDKPKPRGEVVAWTNRTSPGYYNDPVSTTKSFVEIAGERWFRTGDIGTIDEHGKVSLRTTFDLLEILRAVARCSRRPRGVHQTLPR